MINFIVEIINYMPPQSCQITQQGPLFWVKKINLCKKEKKYFKILIGNTEMALNFV